MIKIKIILSTGHTFDVRIEGKEVFICVDNGSAKELLPGEYLSVLRYVLTSLGFAKKTGRYDFNLRILNQFRKQGIYLDLTITDIHKGTTWGIVELNRGNGRISAKQECEHPIPLDSIGDLCSWKYTNCEDYINANPLWKSQWDKAMNNVISPEDIHFEICS